MQSCRNLLQTILASLFDAHRCLVFPFYEDNVEYVGVLHYLQHSEELLHDLISEPYCWDFARVRRGSGSDLLGSTPNYLGFAPDCLGFAPGSHRGFQGLKVNSAVRGWALLGY